MIDVRGLRQTYRAKKLTVEAVRGIDFTVEAGEIVGFLGPNGAGKTTTLRMLTTLLRPTAGQAQIAGADLLQNPKGVRARIGYVAQAGGADRNALVAEELVLQARLYGVPAREARRRASELLARLDLADLDRRVVKTLSGGQHRRLDVAIGLVHRPSLLFLDEPSTGLDPQSRSNLWDHIRRLREELGTTVFLTTHYLDEADALCDRILVIDHGQIVAEGTPEELKRRVSGDVVTIGVGDEAVAAKDVLTGQPGVREVVAAEDSVRLTVDEGGEAVATLMKVLDGAGVRVRSIQLHRPTLEDVFLTLTGRSLRDEAA
ncbi:daunorubicin resistance protein DrrA family ABC transporter ATP-binding protein [Pseudofrankia inefficax]|uniref:daunorubicin resistance protein DrrA family ABC transporter ATP-binding protein n=1 Tax=Pseudofrankia inefficax (strain DSM 45817 / CECT 9037 / DDB 130130 / EuI1c) TaxID=298654 RepID=UPI00059DC3F4